MLDVPISPLFHSGLRRLGWNPTAAAVRGDEASAKAKSSCSKGIRVTHSGLSLTYEAELAKQFREGTTLERRTLDPPSANSTKHNGMLTSSPRTFASGCRRTWPSTGNWQIQARRTFFAGWRSNHWSRQRDASSHQPADAGTGGVGEEVDKARAAVNSAREKYVQQILKIRSLADRSRPSTRRLKKTKHAPMP